MTDVLKNKHKVAKSDEQNAQFVVCDEQTSLTGEIPVITRYEYKGGRTFIGLDLYKWAVQNAIVNKLI